MPEKSNPNKEHRKRLKKRFLQEGFDSFEEHITIQPQELPHQMKM